MVLCTAVFMLLLDTTIVNIAQVKIKEGLDADLSQIQWVLDSYILTYAVLLLSFGRLGDVFGRKKMFVYGMGLFTAASGLCGASAWLGDQVGVSGANALIAARVLQGIGGAFMMPQSLSILSTVFPPEKRGAAMGIWSSVVGVGAVLGPVIGGLIVTNYAWEWVFLINIPIGIAAILATIAIVPESTDPQASKRVDWGGVVLSGVGIFALVYALIDGDKRGWTSPVIVTLFVASVVLLVGFVWWEQRAPDPMMKLELFKIRNFWVSNVITLMTAFGMFGIFFPMTIFLQQVLGFSAIRAGLTTVPMSVAMMVIAPVTGRVSDRIGARWFLVSGLSMMTAGIFYIIARTDLQTDWQRLLLPMSVAGAGMGMTFAPMTAAAMRDVPPRIAGSASGIFNTMRNIGQVIGIAVLGTVLSSRTESHISDRLTSVPLDPATHEQVVTLSKTTRFDQLAAVVPGNLYDQVFNQVQLAFIDALHNTFLIGAVACAIGAATAFMMTNPQRAEATQPAHTLSEAETRERAEEAVVAAD
jgi:EmrB/QacA subfamily drug resistance transporter